ncbi:hypothetical protein E6O75_ATG01548 [Venturia nashicola]|uniref:Uncharacterized protein n=1 Tax=Venturia nashicola TaxID=86259 RepID=A0A4Z1PSC8_9PEZI|nr:hypothetical protein E6O75_ATG01548 [Venturia nashicola]
MTSQNNSPQNQIPILFTIASSNRHDLLLTTPSTSYTHLTTSIATLASTSPNCEEFMSKYKKRRSASIPARVKSLKVKWGVGSTTWPRVTVVTEENLGAVLCMMERGVGSGGMLLRLFLRRRRGRGKVRSEK